ncbi:MAG: DUF4176 domain-containing protein [Lachnospiraceae bacterium]|nr:DUF4176 domain-containing protein [Lachnospiraceae bacterium]
MFERTLPIGSVVLLKGANKRLMIIGYCKYKAGDEETVYDYAGCLYPEGFISPDSTALFNHEQIDKIFALGYQNQKRFEFEPKLQAAIDRVKG